MPSVVSSLIKPPPVGRNVFMKEDDNEVIQSIFDGNVSLDAGTRPGVFRL
jgi:hypothetical protein